MPQAFPESSAMTGKSCAVLREKPEATLEEVLVPCAYRHGTDAAHTIHFGE